MEILFDDYTEHLVYYDSLKSGEFILSDNNPIFPPNYREKNEDRISLLPDPTPASLKGHMKMPLNDNSIEVEVIEGNAPVNICFNLKRSADDIKEVGISKTEIFKIPYIDRPNEHRCDCYIDFERTFKNGWCKVRFTINTD